MAPDRPDPHRDPTLRRGGRPRLFIEPTEPITARLPLSVYDRYAIVAMRRGVPLSVVVREVLLAALRRQNLAPSDVRVTL